MKCRPHRWRKPQVGDDAIDCERCGRSIRYSEMSPNIRASIANGFYTRFGHDNSVADEFAGAMREAFCDAVQRFRDGVAA